jgi:hypothetical protein
MEFGLRVKACRASGLDYPHAPDGTPPYRRWVLTLPVTLTGAADFRGTTEGPRIESVEVKTPNGDISWVPFASLVSRDGNLIEHENMTALYAWFNDERERLQRESEKLVY